MRPLGEPEEKNLTLTVEEEFGPFLAARPSGIFSRDGLICSGVAAR